MKNKGCKIDGCDSPHYGEGLCRAHWLPGWQAKHRFAAGRDFRGDAELQAEFWARADRTAPNGCWVWRGVKNPNGYGSIYHRRAHRVAWEMIHGPIPGKAIILHRCDNRSCVNPGHLRLGTHKDNSRDMVRKGRDQHGPNRGGETVLCDHYRERNAALGICDACYRRGYEERERVSKPLRIVAIIQARLGSSRLPGKTLLMLPTGRLVLQEVVHRVSKIEGVDDIVVASPNSPGCDMLGNAVRGMCSHFMHAGDEADVLSRYVKAAAVSQADAVIRITADCPLLNPDFCSNMVRDFRRSWVIAPKNGWDYISNVWPTRHLPHGWDCEIFTAQALDMADANAFSDHDREHVTPFMQGRYKFRQVTYSPERDQGSWKRWTLDTYQDYIDICRVLYQDDARFEGYRQAAE